MFPFRAQKDGSSPASSVARHSPPGPRAAMGTPSMALAKYPLVLLPLFGRLVVELM